VKYLITGAALALLLAGCGGGGGTSLMPSGSGLALGVPNATPTPSSTSTQSAQASVTISIPAPPAPSSRVRHVRYVSSATNSLTFAVVGGTTQIVPLTATSPGCTTTAGGGRSCAISVSAPVGPSVSFIVSTYASADGTGPALSTARFTEAIVSNQINAIALTLDAVVSSLTVALSTSNFTTGQATTSNVTVNALDAAGKTIVIGSNNLVDASDNPVTITLSDSETSATHLSATTVGTAAITLAYNGGTPSATTGSITAGASSSAGSIATGAGGFSFGTSSTTTASMSYNASTACIAHVQYTNNVLPANEGEFSTNGLDRTYWGGPHTRTLAPTSTWNGFEASWGRHQYDTYFGDSSDGLGYDPFTVTTDTAAPGSPTALRIEAMPMPANIANSLKVMANDQFIVTSASAPFQIPVEGGTLVVNVANPNSAQTNWTVGIGTASQSPTFIGTLTSGGATPSGNGTGGSNPWTISHIHIYSGTAGTTITPGSNDSGGFRSYNFPQYYSGTLDTNVNQQYGFFASRIRLPNYLPALSPAFWTLATGGVQTVNGGLNRDELDIEEMFGATVGNSLNANQILWQQNTSPEGKGVYPFPNGTPQSDYHDYGVLVTSQGTSFYLDGNPISGDTGLPDGTQGSPDKEIMLMFQIGAPGSWLDPKSQAASNTWPQYMWTQWIRIYKPTSTSC
jgi:hypothetical protein